MKTIEVESEDKLVEALTKSIEENAGNKIFTLRVLGKKDEDLDLIVVFEDKSVMMAKIEVQTFEGKLATRVRGDYI